MRFIDWIFLVVGYPFTFLDLLFSARAVSGKRFTEAGLDADKVIAVLKDMRWAEVVRPGEIRVLPLPDDPQFATSLQASFPHEFQKIMEILKTPDRWSVQNFISELRSEKGRRTALAWGESVVVAFIIAMVIRTFLFQPFKIPSGSMRMTLIEGDRLFVNKLDYGPLIPFTKTRIKGFGQPRRGDVIVFRYPVTRDKDFIKRLIAFGGETVEIRDGKIYINDEPVNDLPLAKFHYYNEGEFGAPGQKIVVPPGQFFVLGDNSASSRDSRYWGFVPEYYVIGKAELIFWPLNRIKLIR